MKLNNVTIVVVYWRLNHFRTKKNYLNLLFTDNVMKLFSEMWYIWYLISGNHYQIQSRKFYKNWRILDTYKQEFRKRSQTINITGNINTNKWIISINVQIDDFQLLIKCSRTYVEHLHAWPFQVLQLQSSLMVSAELFTLFLTVSLYTNVIFTTNCQFRNF